MSARKYNAQDRIAIIDVDGVSYANDVANAQPPFYDQSGKEITPDDFGVYDFTDEEMVEFDSSTFISDGAQFCYLKIVGPRPKNIVKRR